MAGQLNHERDRRLSAMRPADIDFPIRYLRELDATVSATVAAGASVEVTLAAAGMSHYGEYSLFDWVHHAINVPAVNEAIRQVDK